MKQVDCYGMPSDYELALLGHREPSVHNRVVAVKRYRITVEEIVESADVLRERLMALQEQGLHIDNRIAIRDAAAALGVQLPTR